MRYEFCLEGSRKALQENLHESPNLNDEHYLSCALYLHNRDSFALVHCFTLPIHRTLLWGPEQSCSKVSSAPQLTSEALSLLFSELMQKTYGKAGSKIIRFLISLFFSFFLLYHKFFLSQNYALFSTLPCGLEHLSSF